MNNVVLIGRLTKKPEVRYTQGSGDQLAVAVFTLAVDRPARAGKERQADFIRITVFGRQAENCERYLDKGRQVAVQGRIQTGSYTNKDGSTVYTTDVVAERVEFLGSGGAQGESRGYSESGFGGAQSGGDSPSADFGDDSGFKSIIDDDDLPF